MSRILVLEDDRYLRMLYALELAAEGYEVVLAPAAANALKYVKRTRPDVVVVNAPKHPANPHVIAAKIRNRANGIPLILNTACGMSEDTSVPRLHGAPATRRSPISELKRRIRELLARKHQGSEQVAVNYSAAI